MDTNRITEHVKSRKPSVDMRSAIERLERAVAVINTLLKGLRRGH